MELNSPTIVMKLIKPFRNESLNTIYNQLFCDMPELYKKELPAQFPWNVLQSPDTTVGNLVSITEDEKMESRVRLLAYTRLMERSFPVNKKELLGVIVEVPIEGGLDVLAAYKDGTARYINHSERMIIWETSTEESGKLINDLFNASMKVVHQIGPWLDARFAPPGEGNVRISFLVSNGLHFGQGPYEVLAKDLIGGPVIQAALKLMMCLTETVHV